MANEEQQKGLEIEMSAEVAQGKYANLALIAHGPNEFFIDMICVAPNMPKAKVQSRIIMTPENAKNLMMAVTESRILALSRPKSLPHHAKTRNSSF